MVRPYTRLKVADNSGARELLCIRVLKGNSQDARVGDVIVGAVKQAAPGAAIKKGDTVRVLTGRSSGHTGRIASILPRTERAIVEGANLVTRHQRARGGQTVTAEQRSGRIEKPSPIHVSNLMVICPNCNRPTRIAHRESDGRMVRACKQQGCGDVIDRGK